MNCGKLRIIYLSHNRSISPLNNAIIVDFYIEVMNKIFNIISNDLTMPQMFHSESVWSLDKVSLLNTQMKFFGMPAS